MQIRFTKSVWCNIEVGKEIHWVTFLMKPKYVKEDREAIPTALSAFIINVSRP
jgi:hypothetical protein